MKAVPDNNTAQSVIDEIASTIEPEETEESTEEQDLNGNQDTGDSSNLDDDQGAGADENSEDEGSESNKDNKAFAAMRVEIKELKKELSDALAKLNQNDESDDDESDEDDNSDEAAGIKETDSDEVKELKRQLAELKKDFTTDRDTRLNEQKKAQLVSEIRDIQKNYKLDGKALLQFADDAKAKGFIIGESPLTVDQIYKLTYHDQLVAKGKQDIQEIENQTNQGLAPGTGPKGGSSGSTKPKKASDVVRELAREHLK